MGDDGLPDTNDDVVIPVTPRFDGNRSVILTVDPAFAPLEFGDYQLTLAASIEDRDGNPLNSVTGIAGGSSSVHPFRIVRDPLRAGTVQFDRGFYEVGDTVAITVRDSDLIGTGHITVDVTSTLGDHETVTLNETDDGVFQGNIATDLTQIATDNLLALAVGDTITVQYLDADDGTGFQSTIQDAARIAVLVDIFNADFSDANGERDAQGFGSHGPSDQWHISVGRNATSGHSQGASFYFGAGEGSDGNGVYSTNADGTLVSPTIDLFGFDGAELAFTQFLDVEPGRDIASVVVMDETGTETVLANTTDTGRLANTAGGFELVQLDLSPYAGQRIQIQYRLESDALENFEGWYVDDVSVRVPVVELDVHGPTVTSVDVPATITDPTSITNLMLQFSEMLAQAPAIAASSYRLREAGGDGILGTADDVSISVLPQFDRDRTVTLNVDANSAPLGFGSYELTVSSAVEDLLRNPLNSTTGAGGGSESVYRFDVVFDPTRQGTIQLDADTYVTGDTVTVEVRDSDLAGSGSIGVMIASSSGDSETVTLVEAASGVFSGAVVTDSVSILNDGKLAVTAGDVVTATYHDVDDGTGASAVVTDSANIVLEAVQLPSGGNSVEIFIDAQDLVVRRLGGAELSRSPLQSVTGLTIDGSDAADTLILDFRTLNALPINTLTFNGRAGDDTLVVTGGSFDTVRFDFANANDGMIHLDAFLVNLTSLEPVSMTGTTVTDLIFNLPASADRAILEDVGSPNDGQSQLRSVNGTFETTQFGVPTGSLIINAGAGDDTITLVSADALMTGMLLVNGEGGRDALDGSALDLSVALAGGVDDDNLRGGSGNDTLDGGAGHDTLTGNRGSDYLFGNSGRDSLSGGQGDDYVSGQGSADTVSGGVGTDTIVGGQGIDLLDATGDVDFTLTSFQLTMGAQTDSLKFGNIEQARLVGGASANRFDLSGFTGTTILYASGGADWINGSLGRDWVDAGAGDDTVYGNAHRDTIYGGEGDDVLLGQGSNDVLRAGWGNDWLRGGAGHDNLGGGPGRDTLLGDSGTDRVVEVTRSGSLVVTDSSLSDGAAAAETDVLRDIEQAWLIGDSRDNTLHALDFSGSVFLIGGDGNDTLLGGLGNDTLLGGRGADSLYGGAGNDGLSGMDGDDTLSDGDGSDTVLGGAGDDLIVGGHGSDTILGEAGSDSIFTSDGEADTVTGGGHGDPLSPLDTVLTDSNDTIDDAFSLFPTWAGGLP